MGGVQVKKVVAVCFLEAVKLALEHLGTYRLEMSQHGVVGSTELPRLYGEARRLRDYLQRCASAYQDLVDLDLADSDRALLVACCRRLVESVDMRLSGEQLVPSEERQYLTKKRDVMADCTVELAQEPLLELPLPKLSPVQTECSRGLMSRLVHKLFGPPGPLLINRHGQSTESQTTGTPAVVTTTPSPAVPAQAAKPEMPTAVEPVEPPVAVTALLFDTQTLRDPRLRALAAMDLRSYLRAMEAQDHRIAAVLLASVLESAILDHAVPRRTELGLMGTPDGWNPVDVLGVALGDKLQPQDRSLAYHLFAARNLLRPSLQIVTPSVVTASSLERLREFVHRTLGALGFSGGDSVGQGQPRRLLSKASSG